jgi:hypothetical protein
MLGSFRRLLAHSDVREAFAVSLLGRLPMRLIDRHGPGSILMACAALYPLALIGVVATVSLATPLS